MTACVLDSDALIAALDRADAHHPRASRAIRALDGQELLLSLVNYAEVLVRPAEDEDTLRRATNAISALGIKLVAPTATMARQAAQHRRLNISLADGFAMATAQDADAALATFDRRVRRALPLVGLTAASGF
jgi:predicted nucleic acid-binding protein